MDFGLVCNVCGCKETDADPLDPKEDIRWSLYQSQETDSNGRKRRKIFRCSYCNCLGLQFYRAQPQVFIESANLEEFWHKLMRDRQKLGEFCNERLQYIEKKTSRREAN